MTGRTVPEWVGDTLETPIPKRVKLRLFDAADGQCAHCGVKIRPGNGPEYDHRVALINGGTNDEANIDVLCIPCHRAKTRHDVAEKAKTYRKRSKHLGIAKPSRPMPGSKASPWKRTFSGAVVRREEI